MTSSRIRFRWEHQGQQRFYEVLIGPDLFGITNVTCIWGSMETRLGGIAHHPVDNHDQVPRVSEDYRMNEILPHQPAHKLGAPFLQNPIPIDWHQLIARRPALLSDYNDLPHYLLKPEITSLLESVHDHTDRFLFNTLWHTGARVSEVLSLRPDSFHLDHAGGAYVVLKTLKQGRPGARDTPARRVPLRDLRYIHGVKRYIQSNHIRKKQKLFCLHRATVYKHIQKWVRAYENAHRQAFGIDVGPHTFRHSFAINALFHMVPLTVIQQWLGHRRLETTAVYLRVFAPDTDAFMEWVAFE